jgi:peroxiredoxin
MAAGASPVLAAIAALAWAGWALAAEPLGRVEIGAAAPGFTAQGADGLEHRLADYAGQAVVLEWTSPVCPYTAIKYRGGLMQALQRRAARQGVAWIAIDTAAPGRAGYLTPDAAQARIARTGARVTAFLSDPDGRIGRAYGVRTTPSLYVIGRDGRLAYQGAVDDDPGRSRPGGGDHVSAALGDLAAGRPVRTPETRPYGCAVEY